PMDAHTAENYPWLVDACLERGWEPVGHGITQRQAITSLMPEAEERSLIERSIQALRSATGRAPSRWLGPEHSQSTRTPAILAECGARCRCALPHDEPPYPLRTPSAGASALPCMIERGDTIGHFTRTRLLPRWVQMVKETFDVMYEDAAETGLL